MKRVLSVAAALFCLAACNPEQGDSASKAASDTVQTLTSMDGKISISIHNSHFTAVFGPQYTERGFWAVTTSEIVFIFAGSPNE